MPELTLFDIDFPNNPQGVVLNGQVLTGKVRITVDKPIEVRAVILEIAGFSEVRWTRSSNLHNRSHLHHSHHHMHAHMSNFVYDREDYFNIQMKLFGEGQKMMMEAGSYEFPFSSMIPATAPSTFEGLMGFIRYYCKVVVDRPWAFDYTAMRPFTVISVTDLNYLPDINRPMQVQNAKQVGTCCTYGNVEATLSIPAIGYVPGQSIPVDAVIENKSSAHVNGTKLCIVQMVRFWASGFENLIVNEISKAEKGTIAPNGTDEFRNFSLPVPAVPPSSLKKCRIIDISYFMKLSVAVAKTFTDLNLEIPLVVGTVPVMSRPVPSQSSPAVPQPYPDMPPPSYASCALGESNVLELKDEKESNSGGFTQYVPVYPTYGLNV